MTTLSICFTGLSRDEEATVVSCFKQANARLGNRWLATPESEAGVLVIDMDSMYGQMSLMKALGSGRVLVALTASGRADTDYVLQRPVTVDSLVALLGRIDLDTPEPEAPGAVTPPAPAAVELPAPPASVAVELPAPPASVAAAEEPAYEVTVAEAPEPATLAPPAPEPEPQPPAAAAPSARRLSELLRPGALDGPVQLQLPDAPDLVLDPASQTYLGGTALKPLLPYCSASFTGEEIASVAADALPALAARAGGSQPWSRLAWLCALAGGNGALAEGYGPGEKYRLLKWPQTEREFPKHFRIATVMMKGAADLAEVAQASGASLAEVIDFVNASLATGVVEPEAAPVASPDTAKGGLLARFRR